MVATVLGLLSPQVMETVKSLAELVRLASLNVATRPLKVTVAVGVNATEAAVRAASWMGKELAGET